MKSAETMRSTRKARFDSSARLIMGFALALLILSVAQVAYRYTLPTDGWIVVTQDLGDSDWIYYANLVGARSDLQPEDMILSVGGVSVAGSATFAHVTAPSGWQAGSSVGMVVQRGEQQVSLDVPIVHWTGLALLRYNLNLVQPLGNLLGGLLLLLVGWFTFLRRPDLPSARALLVFSTTTGASVISGILPDGLSVQFNSLAYTMNGFFSYAIVGTLIAPSLLTFTLLFPKPKRIFLRYPWLALLPFGFGLLLLIFFLSGGPGVVGWISTPIMLVASIASLIHAGFTQRDAVSQAQLRWAISSFVLGIGLFLLNFPTAFNWVSNMAVVYILLFLSSFSFAVIGIGFSVAVLRYRLFDIDVIIRRTLQYTLVTGLLALVYFGSVVLLQSILRALTGQVSQVVLVISTLGIAALFNPLRLRVQEFIDRRFYRQKYDAEQAMAHFAAVARDEVAMENLSAAVIKVAEETMQPEGVSLWISNTKRGER
jgi:hypothetical protein